MTWADRARRIADDLAGLITDSGNRDVEFSMYSPHLLRLEAALWESKHPVVTCPNCNGSGIIGWYYCGYRTTEKCVPCGGTGRKHNG